MNRNYSPAPVSGEIPVDVEEPTNLELSQQIGALSSQITSCHAASLRAEANSDLALRETVLLRSDVRRLHATQVEDHAPRILEVERRTLAQRAGEIAKGAGSAVGKGLGTSLRLGSYGTLIAVAGRVAAKAYPQFGEAIEGLLGAFGL